MLARLQNSCSSTRQDVSLIGTPHHMARSSPLSSPPSFFASHWTQRYPSPITSMLSPTLPITTFSKSYLHLPPPTGHHHPPQSHCLTFTSIIYCCTYPNAGLAKLMKTMQHSATFSTNTPYTLQENHNEYRTK